MTPRTVTCWHCSAETTTPTADLTCSTDCAEAAFDRSHP